MQTLPTRAVSWFGKLPCVGDFCSHNMPSDLRNSLDDWLSEAMQTGLDMHGTAWTQAYFEAPVHGFVCGQNALPGLAGNCAVGLLMPSVDKAGREFPFVLLEQFQGNHAGHVVSKAGGDSMTHWFSQARSVCAGALNEDWPLEKLNAVLECLPPVDQQVGHDKTMAVQAGHTQWFRIDCAGQSQWVMQCLGLPRAQLFDALLGLAHTSP